VIGTIMILIGIIFSSLMISAIFMIAYIKALSVFTKWLENKYGDVIRNSKLYAKFFPNVGNKGSESRKDSKIEIGCIYCFEKTYDFFKANKRRVSNFIQSFIGKGDICEKAGNQNAKSKSKYGTTNSESFFHDKTC